MNDDPFFDVTLHVRVTLLNMEKSNVLLDPLTGVPAGLLTMVTVNGSEKYQTLNNNYS